MMRYELNATKTSLVCLITEKIEYSSRCCIESICEQYERISKEVVM
jgi:hypothetical protein